MKKITIFTLVFTFLFSTLALSAQEETPKNEQKPKKERRSSSAHNWFIGAGVGTSLYVGACDYKASMAKSMNLAVDVAFGKWFTPSTGFRIQYSGFNAKGYTNNIDNPTVSGDAVAEGVYPQQFGYHHLHFDFLWNLCDMKNYRADRIYTAVLYVGVGTAFNTEDGTNFALAGSAGLYNRFSVSPSVDITLDLKGTILTDKLCGEVGDLPIEGMAALTVGVNYKFGPRGWKNK